MTNEYNDLKYIEGITIWGTVSGFWYPFQWMVRVLLLQTQHHVHLAFM